MLSDVKGPAGQKPAELFDVVDECDRVVAQAPRAEVHARGLRHRAVHVLVHDPAGRVFLQKRSRWKDTFPGAWTASCAGHVDAGEDYDACAVRELREEIGLAVAAPPVRRLRIEACEETGREFVWIYTQAHDGRAQLMLDAAEVETGGWFSPAEIDAWLAARPAEFAPSFRLLWPLVRRWLVLAPDSSREPAT